MPDISLLIDLADAPNISIDDLLKGNDIQEDTLTFEHSFKVEKTYYRKYLYDQYFCHRLYWIIDLCGVLMIMAGMAALPLNMYISQYITVLAKAALMLGIMLMSVPLFIMIYHIRIFKPFEVWYTLKNDRIIYLCDGEEITYDLQQFCLAEKKKFVYLTNGKKVLWLALDDIKEVKQYVQNKNIKAIKYRFAGKLFFAIVLTSAIILQSGYMIVLKNFGFEYIHDQYEVLMYLVILWAIAGLWMLMRKSVKHTLIYNLWLMIGVFVLLLGIGLSAVVAALMSQDVSLSLLFQLIPDVINNVINKFFSEFSVFLKYFLYGTVEIYHLIIFIYFALTVVHTKYCRRYRLAVALVLWFIMQLFFPLIRNQFGTSYTVLIFYDLMISILLTVATVYIIDHHIEIE